MGEQIRELQNALMAKQIVEQPQYAPAASSIEDRLSDAQGRRDESDIDAALNDITE
jgi:hypothetical protein